MSSPGLLALFAAVGLCSAAEPPARPPASAPAPPASEESKPVIETIEETTVGDLGGVRVPMANMTQGAYTLPDGTETRGLICALVLPGGAVFVGEGSVVEVGGARWEVTSVQKTAGELGSVTLRRH